MTITDDLWDLAVTLGRAQQAEADRRVVARMDPDCDHCLDCRDGVHTACQVCTLGSIR